MIQTDDEIKKEFEESEVCQRITSTESFAINHGFEQWHKQTVSDWWLSKFHTLQEEYKNSHHKVFTRSEWVRYQVVIEDKIREEYKKELIEKIESKRGYGLDGLYIPFDTIINIIKQQIYVQNIKRKSMEAMSSMWC